MQAAGGESTYATVLIFLMAMALNPSVQCRAQSALDNVIGFDRFPTFQDRDRLEYIDAVIKETMRWHPALPLGIARQTAKDDLYKGLAHIFLPSSPTHKLEFRRLFDSKRDHCHT